MREREREREMNRDSANAALSRVGDDAEDQVSAGTEVDTNNVKEALEKLNQEETKAAAEEAVREKALAAVKVEKADIETIVNEFELSTSGAKRKLQENAGDLQKTLVALIKSS